MIKTLLAASLLALAPLGGALAQAFPSKPITLVVPWPAGGSTDRHLRGLSEIASRHLGQPILINEQTRAGLSSAFRVQDHGSVQFKTKAQRVQVYSVVPEGIRL